MKVVALLVVLLGAVGCFAGQPESIDAVEPHDYKLLLKKCNGNSCCEASARRLEASKGFVIKDGKFVCPIGFTPNGLKCLESYMWCEPSKK